MVLDSSVLISAFLTPRGTSATVLVTMRQTRFTLCLSREIVTETTTRLIRKLPRLAPRYAYTEADVARFARDLAETAVFVTDLPVLDAVPLDPDDNIIIATAVAARADLLVTGDRHLLDLERHAAIRIIDPRRFLGELAKADPGAG
ncbi:MAG: putative toxin-antitoxin system toxin component, PIN family [Geminicoccaceae bacterium]